MVFAYGLQMSVLVLDPEQPGRRGPVPFGPIERPWQYQLFDIPEGESFDWHRTLSRSSLSTTRRVTGLWLTWTGYVRFKNAAAYTFVKDLLGGNPHVEWSKGDDFQNQHYCSKPHADCVCTHCVDCPPSIGGPWVFGEPVSAGQGKRTPADDAADVILTNGLNELLKTNPGYMLLHPTGCQRLEERRLKNTVRMPLGDVVLVLGHPGAGKSHWVRTLAPQDESYEHAGNSSWFDGYEGEHHIVIDDFDGAASKWNLADVLRLLDGYRLRLAIKGAHTYFHAVNIYVTSNIHPYSWFQWTSRPSQYWALLRRFSKIVICEDCRPRKRHVLNDIDYKRFCGGEDGPWVGETFFGWKVEATSHEHAQVGPAPIEITQRWPRPVILPLDGSHSIQT